MTQTRDIGPLSMRAAVAPATINADTRTVDVVWTTGARVMRGFFERYWEELSLKSAHVRMDRLNSGAPLLDTHDSYDLRGVLGVVESARIKDGQGTATVRFAKTERAEEIWQQVHDGIIRNVSVGYRVHRLEKVEDDADKIPVYRATDWEPYEISLVPMGADAGAGVRAAGVESNPCQFVEGELRQEQEPMKDEQKPGAPPAPESKDAARTAPIDEQAVRQGAAKAERERIKALQRTARTLGLSDEFVERHIGEGTSADAFRALAEDEYEKARKPYVSDDGRAHVVPGEDARDKWMRGAQAWLMERAAVGDAVAEAAQKRGEKIDMDPGEFRGLKLVDLARQSLERSGVSTKRKLAIEVVGMALTQRGGGYAATGDFPVLLENTMHKVLLAAYAIQEDTWSLFCAVGSVSDFRAHNRYREGSFGNLSVVNEHGEFKNLAIPDGEKETITAATKGNIIAITRQALVNDDMSAFSRMAMALGRAARRTIEADVYALLAQNSGLGPNMADGSPLFDDSAHSNVNTSASELSVAGLDADRVVMASQVDPGGNDYLDLRPAILLVPIGQGGDARVINDAKYDPDTADKIQKPNKVRGLFRTVVDTPRLSGNRRYLFADPAVAPVLEVAFLDGQQQPFMEIQEGWRIDGVEWKIRLDYGVGAVDYRGAVTNAGSSGE